MEFALADLWEVVVDWVPERTALVAGERRLTYAELDERANRLANHLISAGVRPGERVAIHSWNRAEWMEAMLGAFKARAVPVNVSYRYVASEVGYVLEDSDSVALVHERSFSALVEQLRPELPAVAHALVIEDGAAAPPGTAGGAGGARRAGGAGGAGTAGRAGAAGRTSGAVAYEEALGSASPARPAMPRSGDDLYLLYTGGTTGRPKGVIWRQEDIFFAALGGGGFGRPPITRPEELAERVVDRAASRAHVVTAPMMHGGGQWVSFIHFFAGETVVLHTGRRFDPHEVWDLVEREGAASVMVVGDAMARPLAEALEHPSRHHDVSSVASIGSGGAILSGAVKEELYARLPGVTVRDSFGASETGAAGVVLDPRAAGPGPRFTVGPETTVLDDDLCPVPAGSSRVGRLARRGHIPLGYHKDPERTAATFPVDSAGTRWSVPGDHATVGPDGTILLLGRGTACINSGGEKIYPEEVEAALKSHPDVYDAVVLGVPDLRFGEQVTAVVQPRPGAEPALESLVVHCRSRVAGYKVPRRLVVVEQLARTAAGKPDYRCAREHVANLVS